MMASTIVNFIEGAEVLFQELSEIASINAYGQILSGV